MLLYRSDIGQGVNTDAMALVEYWGGKLCFVLFFHLFNSRKGMREIKMNFLIVRFWPYLWNVSHQLEWLIANVEFSYCLNELPNSWVYGYKIGNKRNPMLEKNTQKNTLKHFERLENHDNFNVETFPLKSSEGPLRSRCAVWCNLRQTQQH